MAKNQSQEPEKPAPVTVLEVPNFVVTEQPKKEIPQLKRGEVLVSEIDENGNEQNYFVSNQKTFDDFYSKNPKFKLKKK
ncbi:hypothetical protein N6B72_05125 [Chryseobacterium soli]|uniref:hypothetical protein n=1 Tax=Chryseobacterium soli TaxID=445961 RepID=UPI00295498D5|nr:hypothetical protein [Chryseobacterium soli]MDV7696297.1 hypothetical protein [Chryseobacterium soli]